MHCSEHRQIAKNVRWDACPCFQAVDGKQALGSTGLRQLEKFAEGAERGSAVPPSLQEKANS